MAQQKIIDDTYYYVMGFVFDEDSRLLLFKRTYDDGRTKGWEPVKGGHYIGETEEDAILREIDEEAGIEVSLLERLTEPLIRLKPEMQVHTVCFVCRYMGGIVRLAEPEHVSFGWKTREEAREDLWPPGTDNMLELAFDTYALRR